MANRTVKDAHTIHGTNPQYLIEKIIRSRIYECKYWKEECFALTSELLVDKAMELKYVGGVVGGNIRCVWFMEKWLVLVKNSRWTVLFLFYLILLTATRRVRMWHTLFVPDQKFMSVTMRWPWSCSLLFVWRLKPSHIFGIKLQNYMKLCWCCL